MTRAGLGSLAATIIGLLALGQPARAAGGALVILVYPPAAPPTVKEALVHLRGELTAAGFEAQILEVPIGSDVRASLERVAPGVDAVAIVAVLPVVPPGGADPAAPDPAAAEMWVVDRVTRKTVVRRARADADRSRAAEILSVRAVELLRASFVELAIISTQPPPSTAPAGASTATRWVATAIDEQPRRWRYGLELGGAVMGSLERVRPALMPVVRLERALGERALLRLSGAGLGSAVLVATNNGDAAVTEDLLLLEGVLRFRQGQRVQPLLSLGAGALRVAAEGRSSGPYLGISGARWSAAADAGAGLRLSIRRWLELATEAHALVAEPYPVVHFFDREIAHAGRPSLLASVTVVGGL